MRSLLRGARTRVERLQARVEPTADEIDARLQKMSDEDLDAFFVELIEESIGPAEGFATAQAFVDALCAAEHLDPDEDAFPLRIARDRWLRLRWLHDHGSHGRLTFVTHWCIRPDPKRLWGPGMVATCTCGETYAMFRALVPPAFRHLLPDDARDPSRWVTTPHHA